MLTHIQSAESKNGFAFLLLKQDCLILLFET